ncbi:MAG TPA: serpin family protein [Actinomycetes bacterium]|nr:serpin family protein [Actinomycetes bacterium]
MHTPRFPDLDRRTLLGGSLGLAAVGSLPWLAGCSSTPSTAAVDPGPPQQVGLISADLPRKEVSIDSPMVDEVVAGIASFGIDLHRVTATSTENWTASPLSIAVAAGMLRAGCRGETAEQLDGTLHFPKGDVPEGLPHEALNALTAELVTTVPVKVGEDPVKQGQPGPKPIVGVANALFIDTDFQSFVKDQFLALLAQQYGAGAIGVNFDAPSAVNTINEWVSTQTRDRIKTLFKELDPATVLVLCNAVYLKATWAEQFDEPATKNGNFTSPTGVMQVPLMNNTFDRVPYIETDSYQRVTLAYVGDELSMRIVLPRDTVTDVDALNALLDVAVEPHPAQQSRAVDLTLPKWDAATDIDLRSVLSELGMTDAFDPNLADLSGIADADLYVAKAVHRANVTVDEKGTEAAAVTGFAVEVLSAIIALKMRVDRPFVWAVMHEPTGTPVFVGHVVNPM